MIRIILFIFLCWILKILKCFWVILRLILRNLTFLQLDIEKECKVKKMKDKVSPSSEYTDMKILECEVHEGAFFMGNKGTKIFANNNIPTLIKFLIELFLDYASNFGILLSFEYIGHIGNFFDGSIGDTDDGAFVLWL